MNDSKLDFSEFGDLRESSFDVEIRDLNTRLGKGNKENKIYIEEPSEDFSLAEVSSRELVDVGLDICRENVGKIHEYLDFDREVEEKLIRKLKSIEKRLDDILANSN